MNEDRDLIRGWVETWRTAVPELEAIRLRESSCVPIPDAARQLFEGMESVLVAPCSGNIRTSLATDVVQQDQGT
jgi:hypothetical protein